MRGRAGVILAACWTILVLYWLGLGLSSALAASPTPGASASGKFFSASTTATITTGGNSGILTLHVFAASGTGGSAQTISTVSSTSGLVWTRLPNASDSFVSSTPSGQRIDVWWAPFGSTLTSEVVTVTLSGGPNCGAILVNEFNGVNSTAAPFDLNVAAQRTATDNSAVVVSGFSTTNSNDLVVWGSGGAPSTTANDNSPTGFTGRVIVGSTTGGFCGISTSNKAVSVPQVGQSYQSTTGGPGVSSAIALTADAATAVPSAVLFSTGPMR